MRGSSLRFGPSVLLWVLSLVPRVSGQTVILNVDPSEKTAERPYELVEANRREPAPPTVRFDDLRGWRVFVEGGAQAVLRASRAFDVWGRPVAQLRYRRTGTANAPPRITLIPPYGVMLPQSADAADFWAYGNRWEWENPPDTPALQVRVHLRDAAGRTFEVNVDTIRWWGWWMMHRKLPRGMVFPVVMEHLEFSGGTQPEWREIYLDSIRFYREQFPPLEFKPRPKRNLTLFGGQSPGANTGPGTLAFPTREATILPAQTAGAYRNEVQPQGRELFTFSYSGSDCTIRYTFDAAKGLAGISAQVDNAAVGSMFNGAGVRRAIGVRGGNLTGAQLAGTVAVANYTDGTELRLRIWQKSLVVDVSNLSGQAVELELGRMVGLTDPRTVWVPFITYAATNPCLLLSRAGGRWVFTSLWADWYRSNGSELYGAEYAGQGYALINGGVRYLRRTDSRLNPLYERLFLTVSPEILEVLPTIPNPVGLHAPDAVDRIWMETYGPQNYDNQMKQNRKLRAYGIEKLTQCNHELTWRDAAESFTLREHAAPKRGGDAALQRFLEQVRGLGWLAGLYTNYVSVTPTNSYWNPNFVLLKPDGDWWSNWPRCWTLKPLWGVEFEYLLAPRLKQRYNPNASYTDVHTAAAPWLYTDYDARVPGAGTFAQTYYAFGELLRHESEVYGGPVSSEGTFQWLYAGLTDGNFARAYDNHPLAREPLFPIFALHQIHTKECGIGMGNTTMFCEAIPDWQDPRNLDNSIDRFLLNTLAYGNAGWLVEDKFGIARTCRSYYMLQQVQARYGLKAPTRLAYWDGRKLCGVSEAAALELPDDRRQLYVEYPGGLALWLNDHPQEDWRIEVNKEALTLPPAGWAVWQSDGSLFSYSAAHKGGKADYIRSPGYIYLDGRGSWFSAPEAAGDGALAITPLSANALQVLRISGKGMFIIRRPFGVQGVVGSCEAYDLEGNRLSPPTLHEGGGETQLEPVPNALRYVLNFSGRPAWSVAPAQHEMVAGTAMPLKAAGVGQVSWSAGVGEVRGNQLILPAGVPVDTWIGLRAEAGNESRETGLRVCAPVRWRWRTLEHFDDTHLFLMPSWNLKGLGLGDFSVEIKAPPGWDADPPRFPIATANLPGELEVRLRSTAPAGTEGPLQVALAGLPQPFATTLRVKRVSQKPIVADLVKESFSWGIARRRDVEKPDPGNTGAQCYRTNNLTVGGVARRGIFMHPPYLGGVGYTWAETEPVDLPSDPAQFQSYVGVKDGAYLSDGVLFKASAIDEKGTRSLLGQQLAYPGRWATLVGDLKPFAGKRIHLQLVADPGPADNTTSDWSCWGEPLVVLASPKIITQVAAEP